MVATVINQRTSHLIDTLILMMPKKGAWQYRPSLQRLRSRYNIVAILVGFIVIAPRGFDLGPLGLSRLAQVDATAQALAFQIHVVGHGVPVGGLDRREIVVEDQDPFQDQMHARLDQDHVDQHPDHVAFLADVHAASQASRKDSSWEQRLASFGPA